MNHLIEDLPPILQDIREYKVIMESEDKAFDKLDQAIKNLSDDQFVLTSSERAIKRYEKMFGILAKPMQEDMEFRRERIINRLCMIPPYSKHYLALKLDEVIGIGKWKLDIDNENYTFCIESSALDQQWFEEINVTIHKIKPCNMVFINKPFIKDTMKMAEYVSYNKIGYNYGLGSWRLGAEPFVYLTDKGIVKDGGKMSISNHMLTELACESANKVTGVLVNNKLKIQDFMIKENDGIKVIIEYKVAATDIEEQSITNIKLLDFDEKVLTSADIYIPVIEDMLIKHTMTMKEGV